MNDLQVAKVLCFIAHGEQKDKMENYTMSIHSE